MIITMLGTNGWFDTETGQTMCTLIRTRDYSIILDAGYGIRRVRQLIDYDEPVYLLLSHLHLDHIIGLHTIEYLNFQHPLKIVVPAGQQQYFQELGRLPYTSNWMKVFPEGTELLGTDELDDAGFQFGIKTLPLKHPVPDHGYRLEIEGKTVAYLCDTGYCENAVTLAAGADLVIAECGAYPGTVTDKTPHMDPETCAKLAVEAGVKQMVLTHFSAAKYQTIAERMKAVEPAREIFPNLITGTDNLEIIL